MQKCRVMTFCRHLGICWTAGGLLLLGGPQEPAKSEPSANLSRNLLNQYCIGCHNDQLKTAGLSLSTVNVENVAENREIWEKVLRKLKARYMPPSGLPRPDERTYDAFANYLE